MVAQTTLTVRPMKMGHVLQTYTNRQGMLQQPTPSKIINCNKTSLLLQATHCYQQQLPPTRQIYQPQRACIKRCQSPHPIRSWTPMMRATPRCQHVACSTRPQPGVYACSFATSYISKEEPTSPSKHNDTLSVLNPTLTPFAASRIEAAK